MATTRNINFQEPLVCKMDKDGSINCWTEKDTWIDEAKHWLDTYNLPRTGENILMIAEAMDEAGERKAIDMGGHND
ncbi:MAG: hypothetical protein NTW30_02445 [Candidatus Aenigmarchaeota archaeon]|nr:hypothetical protein [Candidatus Aenigmarchaeota archaeon]